MGDVLYVVKMSEGKVTQPLTESQVLSLIKSGRLSADQLVRRSDDKMWEPLHSVFGLGGPSWAEAEATDDEDTNHGLMPPALGAPAIQRAVHSYSSQASSTLQAQALAAAPRAIGLYCVVGIACTVAAISLASSFAGRSARAELVAEVNKLQTDVGNAAEVVANLKAQLAAANLKAELAVIEQQEEPAAAAAVDPPEIDWKAREDEAVEQRIDELLADLRAPARVLYRKIKNNPLSLTMDEVEYVLTGEVSSALSSPFRSHFEELLKSDVDLVSRIDPNTIGNRNDWAEVLTVAKALKLTEANDYVSLLYRYFSEGYGRRSWQSTAWDAQMMAERRSQARTLSTHPEGRRDDPLFRTVVNEILVFSETPEGRVALGMNEDEARIANRVALEAEKKRRALEDATAEGKILQERLEALGEFKPDPQKKLQFEQVFKKLLERLDMRSKNVQYQDIDQDFVRFVSVIEGSDSREQALSSLVSLLGKMSNRGVFNDSYREKRLRSLTKALRTLYPNWGSVDASLNLDVFFKDIEPDNSGVIVDESLIPLAELYPRL